MKTDNQISVRLSALRALMKEQGIEGYIIPHDDAFQSEYLRPCDERLAAITGFKGDYGVAVVLAEKALLAIPGRDELQAKIETDPAYEHMIIKGLEDHALWVAEHVSKGSVIGYDPMLVTAAGIKKIAKILKKKKITLKPVESNLVDAVWKDRPIRIDTPVEIFPVHIAGRSSEDKRGQIAQVIKKKKAGGMLVIKPDSIAWLFNARGGDVPYNPYILSYAILYPNGAADWFVDPSRVSADVAAHLGDQIQVRPPSELASMLADFRHIADGLPMIAESSALPIWFVQQLKKSGVKIKDVIDPIKDPRSAKTPQEQESITKAHVHDGVAMVRFLKWVDEHVPQGMFTEWDVAQKMGAFRREAPGFRDLSFGTLAAWQQNAAIIHYTPTADNNATIKGDGFLLVDSGSQYLCDEFAGTTDITRTVVVGTPTELMKRKYTQVLKGHIALARQVFELDAGGQNLEMVAMQYIINDGHVYPHLTGHGVGCYSSVHERGGAISTAAKSTLFEGMLISNEPGFYQEGQFGIRTENLNLVETFTHQSGAKLKRFKTVSLAPIDTRAIDRSMMSLDEIAWLNDYHARVMDTLSPHLNDDEKRWLDKACTPLPLSIPAPAPSI